VTAAVLAAVLAAYPPYVRTHVDPNDPGSHCLYWDQPQVTYHQSNAGNPVTGDAAFIAIEKAFATWQAQLNTCGNLTLDEGPRTDARKVGAPVLGENVVLFRETNCADVVPSSDPCWFLDTCANVHDCWNHDRSALALTTISFDQPSGRILDADIELNGAGFYFTTVDSPACGGPPYSQSCVAYDIQNTVTHEAGHLLGLDHDGDPASVMNPVAGPGDLNKRTLDPGSAQFVCDVYPKGKPAQDCVAPAPKDTPPGGCEVGGGSLLGLLVLLRRRRA
jgi:hypothetical protein